MAISEIIRKFIGSSYVLHRAALEVNERLPHSLRYRIAYGAVFFEWAAFLRESDTWQKDKLREFQFEQLKKLLAHSMKNVPFYGRLFSDYGFNPLKMQAPEDITVLPYLSKKTVGKRLDEFIDRSVPRESLVKDRTSGSTGMALTVYKDKKALAIYQAFLSDSLNRIGYTLKSKEVRFLYNLQVGNRRHLPFVKHGNRLTFSNQHLSEEWLPRYAEVLKRFDPEFITGSPYSVALLASFIRNRGLIPPRRIKAVIVFGETLYDWQETLLSEVFGARVFSVYSMRESAIFGGSCEYDIGIHIYPQHGLTESAALIGDCREVIVTGFTNYAMPLLRYRTGDMVRRFEESCPRCGRHHHFVGNIDGRVNAFLFDSDGRVAPQLYQLIRFFPNVRQCQFYQDEPGKAQLRVVRAEKYSERDTPDILSRIRATLGPMKDTLDIKIVFFDEIPKTSSGKIKVIDQKLDVRTFLSV